MGPQRNKSSIVLEPKPRNEPENVGRRYSIKCRLHNIKESLHKDEKMPLWYVFYRDQSLRMGWRKAKEVGGWLGEL